MTFPIEGKCTYWAEKKDKFPNAGIIDCPTLGKRIMVMRKDLIGCGRLFQGEEVLISRVEVIENGTNIAVGVKPKAHHEYWNARRELKKELLKMCPNLLEVDRLTKVLTLALGKVHVMRREDRVYKVRHRKIVDWAHDIMTRNNTYELLPPFFERNKKLLGQIACATHTNRVTDTGVYEIARQFNILVKTALETPEHMNLVYELYYALGAELCQCNLTQYKKWAPLHSTVKIWIEENDLFSLLGAQKENKTLEEM